MKRSKNEPLAIRRFKFSYILLGAVALYLILVCLKFPDLFESAKVLSSSDDSDGIMDGLLRADNMEEGDRNRALLGSVGVAVGNDDEVGERNKSRLSSLTLGNDDEEGERMKSHLSFLDSAISGGGDEEGERSMSHLSSLGLTLGNGNEEGVRNKSHLNSLDSALVNGNEKAERNKSHLSSLDSGLGNGDEEEGRNKSHFSSRDSNLGNGGEEGGRRESQFSSLDSTLDNGDVEEGRKKFHLSSLGSIFGDGNEKGERNRSHLSSNGSSLVSEEGERNKSGLSFIHADSSHRIFFDNGNRSSLLKPKQSKIEKHSVSPSAKPRKHAYFGLSVMIFQQINRTRDISPLDVMVDEAWSLGLTEWEEVKKFDEKEIGMNTILEGKPQSCPSWISVTGKELAPSDDLLLLPCGLVAGSSITVVGIPRSAHKEYVPQLAESKLGDGKVLVSQFKVELQGLKAVDGEDPPKIFHLNPRLRGDWSKNPVIEHNTCYRMHWGLAQRCDGLPSKNDEDMLVDGYLRCEKWMRRDITGSKESRIFSWLHRFIGRRKKPEVTWPFPFVEGRMFVLTIRAGVDGYHINAGGRHVSSFPYRTGFPLEDATGLAIKGDVDVHSVYATSLPTSHPSFSPHRVLEFFEKWKSGPVPKNPVKLFIGVLSSTNHFAERMAVRKTWMQSAAIKSANVVVRFFVALNPRSKVNAVLKKEAAYFGDIVILPFMDRYELVVLKTVAICLFGVQNVTADYIMKCDDDTFIRLEAVLEELGNFSGKKSLYWGNLNLRHVPLRSGKWAVSYEEWADARYPPYANGPGYIISMDIARFIVDQHQKHTLRLFKMEDVSMGMWVQQFNSSTPVEYSHDWGFCQHGCIEDYITAHYQSPKQMVCLWRNLLEGRPHCCNF